MAVSLYTGHVGAGKTYEVVKNVILPALLAGRDVVSNIDGLNPALIAEYLGKQAPGKTLGVLHLVHREDLARVDFFPARQKDGSYLPSAFVPLGSFVVVDEAALIWGASTPLLPHVKQFFAEHRHIVGANGVACDLAVIAQNPAGINTGLRNLVEFSVDCRKLSALGLSSKYTTVSYEGAKRSGKFVMGRATRTYDKKIFPLYKSFAANSGTILQTDKRFTIWASKWFWATVFLAPVVIVICMYRLYVQFVLPSHHLQAHHQAPAYASTAPGQAPGPAFGGPAVASPGAPGFPRPPSTFSGVPFGEPSPWHLAGSVRLSGSSFAVLRRPGYPLRYVALSSCILSFDGPVSCRVGNDYFEPESSAGAPGSVPVLSKGTDR